MQQEVPIKSVSLANYWQIYLLILLLIVICVFGLFWLSVSLALLTTSYKLFECGCHLIKDSALKKITHSALVIFYVFIIGIGTKVFLIDIYKIPSESMENTLFPDDIILVNKLIYGPKIPTNFSEVSWINLLFPKSKNSNDALEEPYKRARGISQIKQGDVLVFQLSKTYFVVKRCIAVAGDTLILINGEIYTNAEKYSSPNTIKNKYKLTINNRTDFFSLVDSLTDEDKLYTHNPSLKYVVGDFTSNEIKELRKNSQISITRLIDSFSQRKEILEMPVNARWTFDNMGPLIVPAKGMKIKLTSDNFTVYKKIIRKYERVTIEKKQDMYYLNGRVVTSYTFKQNYYFAMGDNRKEALDSRYTGFIPQENIVGKSTYVLFSNYKNKFRWDRMMKSIQ